MPDSNQVISFETRFLLPFLFDHSSIGKFIEHISTLAIGTMPLWKMGDLASDYSDNLLPFLQLYRRSDRPLNYGAYFRGNSDAEVSLLKARDAQGRGLASVSLRRGIELFVSPYGTAILSVTITSSEGSWSLESIRQLNHGMHLGQAWVTRGDPRVVPIESRLSDLECDVPNLPALCDTLLGGALPYGDLATQFKAIGVQRSFSVATTVRLKSEIDFDELRVRQEFLPDLIGLQGIWPATHCGVPADIASDQYPTMLLNRKHWLAAGHMGFAHLVADQIGTDTAIIKFNDRRMVNATDKMFMQFLYPLTQRLALQAFLKEADEACDELGSENREAGYERLAYLRVAHQHFTLRLHSAQLSEEDTSSRVYSYCRRALGVDQAAERLERMLSDVDRQLTTRESISIHTKTQQSLDTQNNLREKVEWIEVFVVTVYSVELAHHFGDAFAPHENIHHHWSYPGVSMLIVATVTMAAIMNAVGLFEPHHAEHDARKAEHTSTSNNVGAYLLDRLLKRIKSITDAMVGGRRRWALVWVFIAIALHICLGVSLLK